MTHDPAGDLGDALHHTRMIRFGLEAAWTAIDALPDDIDATGDVRDALRTINGWLEKTEAGALRDMLTPRAYAVIRPVSLTTPPSPEAMTAITAAISVLATHELVISNG
jgi:hypothetical protein